MFDCFSRWQGVSRLWLGGVSRRGETPGKKRGGEFDEKKSPR